MAELTTNAGGSKAHRAIKIDMTPLVDLAFLLLTFFILTRTFNERRIMPVDMPEKSDTPTAVAPVAAKNVLNLILAENNKLYWWIGSEPEPKLTTFSKDGIRRVLLEAHAANSKLVVLIKPKQHSKYENLVDVLDEISITHTSRYFLMDYTDEDDEIIRRANTQLSAGHSN